MHSAGRTFERLPFFGEPAGRPIHTSAKADSQRQISSADVWLIPPPPRTIEPTIYKVKLYMISRRLNLNCFRRDFSDIGQQKEAH